MIDKVSGIGLNTSVPNAASSSSGIDIGNQFQSILNDAITRIASNQNEVEHLNAKFVTGQLPDVHQLLIASEKASLNLELTVQIRNKVIEAYQEIMRTQI